MQAESGLENNDLKRSTISEVYTQILDDTQDYADLPSGGATYDKITRATQGAALMLRMRVYMAMDQWDNAIKAGEAVTGYSLSSSCADPFKSSSSWDVFAGKLELVYDIPSLKVTINADDVNLKYNSFLDELDAATYALRTLTNVTAELAKTAQKELYTDSFRSYKSMNDEGGVFNNLTIEGDKMTFDTNDMGTLHLTKITQSNDK